MKNEFNEKVTELTDALESAGLAGFAADWDGGDGVSAYSPDAEYGIWGTPDIDDDGNTTGEWDWQIVEAEDGVSAEGDRPMFSAPRAMDDAISTLGRLLQ